MATTNERSPMAASISAVAMICESEPARIHSQNAVPGCGRPAPLASSTAARNTSANGQPNRNRTWVAPTVPSRAVSSRCIALRAVCPAAAMIVNTAQSQLRSIIGNFAMVCGERGGGGSTPPRGRDHVVHVDIVGKLPGVGEEVVDDAFDRREAQAGNLHRGLELVRRHQYVPAVGAARQPAEQIFGPPDGERKALG